METDEYSGRIPEIRLPIGADASAPNTQLLSTGFDAFQKNGCLLIRNAFDKSELQQLRTPLLEQYREMMDQKTRGQSRDLREGYYKRRMLRIKLEKGFKSRSIWANKTVFPLINRLLGEQAILGKITAVVAWPGAPSQQMHFDHPDLFASYEISKFAHKLPTHCLQLVLPLVDITMDNGPTRCWPGSHKLAQGDRVNVDPQSGYSDPLTTLGDCFLIDFRTLHSGLCNNSNRWRPVLFITYQRPWFRDASNYYRIFTPKISDQDFLNIPDELKFSVEHATPQLRRLFVQ
ncbi:MAG TPA: phytanoyl-CoA dioxygenase family protein [Limnobacter sp.]|uniref:phytanoyl-CoA dioxygenase family protein n=1 Tax=Limnobacter sp. TaxID=2003368 RepID=UPI002E372AD9|nr:phytanoyl-CoA dioxygenase family protein [Limnobacter sp.]HEX5484533.1 phytanoyl-CoA dioxygenase family protein [Limnobacter sp.]